MAKEKTPALEVFLQPKASYRIFQTGARTFRFFFTIYIQLRWVLLQQARLDIPLQKWIWVALCAHILYFSLSLTLPGYPREWRMNELMRRHLLWVYLTNTLHKTVKEYCLCAQEDSGMKHKRMLQLFKDAGLVWFVAIAILGNCQKLHPVTNT